MNYGKPKSLSVHHIVLTISDLRQTRQFYTKIFGKPIFSDKYSLMYLLGKTKVFLALPYGKLLKGDKFDANRIGLEHMAFGIPSLKVLKEIELDLTSQKIAHSGIHIDKHSQREKIWLNDPDGIRIEFFL